MDDDIDKTIQIIIADEDLIHKRLDVLIAKKIPELSRSLIKKFYEQGLIQGPDKIELKKMPPVGTTITINLPSLEDDDAKPQNIPLEILYEDEHLIIINKEAGMVVHPAPGNPDGTLVNAILYHCPDLRGIGNIKRPGIVHRLDKGTSGVMVVAKEDKTHQKLIDIFSRHDIERYYEALVLGIKIPQEGKLESTIGRSPYNRLKMKAHVKNGKEAITYFKVLDLYKQSSHLELKLETGRTHQIRVHLSELLNKPIINDMLYGRINEQNQRLSPAIKKVFDSYEHPFLHAKILRFKHPMTGKELSFETPPPLIFQKVQEAMKNE